jgi:hypothetical protein
LNKKCFDLRLQRLQPRHGHQPFGRRPCRLFALQFKFMQQLAAARNRVPLIAFAPVHAFDAVQVVALVDDHVSVEPLPLFTDVGFAPIKTVGGGAIGGVGEGLVGVSPPPPQPLSDATHTAARKT